MKLSKKQFMMGLGFFLAGNVVGYALKPACTHVPAVMDSVVAQPTVVASSPASRPAAKKPVPMKAASKAKK